MLKIKKQKKDYSRILFMSDTHYGHNKEFLYSPRGFESQKQHDEWNEEQIRSIDPDALLVHLGDVGLSVGAARIQEFMELFPCETLMVLGNHNSGVYQAYQQNLPKGFENYQIYPVKIAKNITLLGYEFRLDIDKNYFYCRHMASLVWPDMNRSVKHLCGHSHGNLKQANPNENGFGKILDVGIENAIKYNGSAFFSLEEVLDIMDKKDYSHFDHH